MNPDASEPAAVALLQRFYQCYGAGDVTALKEEILAPDVVWRIPGRHPLSGPKIGAEQILAYFAQMATTAIQVEVLYFSGDDQYVVDVHRGWATTDGTSMDMLFALFCQVKDGRIADVTAFASDQTQCDEWFWKTFPLAPIPDRLARRDQ